MQRIEPMVMLAGLFLLGSGCAEPPVAVDCAGALDTVVKGEVRGHSIDIEQMDVKGGVGAERFYLSFPSPEPGKNGQDPGDWLIDFGYNPLGGLQLAGPELKSDMRAYQDKATGVEPFEVTNKDRGFKCEVLRGELCGGFGVDLDGSGVLEREETLGAERYHRSLSGSVEFLEMEPELWHASFSLEIGWDEDDNEIDGGQLEGCFRAWLESSRGAEQYSFK